MKSRLVFFLFLTFALGVGVFVNFSGEQVEAIVTADTLEDEGGDGFTVNDPCGFLMGASPGLSSPITNLYGVQATSVEPDRLQACADASHNFYATSSGTRDSRLTLQHPSVSSRKYSMDLAGATAETSVAMLESGDYAYWYGSAYITTAGFTGNRWVWFDWDCSAYASATTTGPRSTASGVCPNSARYHVRTNLNTGVTEGYAWNDVLGFISFTPGSGTGNSLILELPPEEVRVDVDVLSSNGVAPHAVDASTAPLADGYDYWRIRVRLYDSSGQSLDASDLSSLTIDPLATADSQVFLDQVNNTGDAILLQSWNPSLGCSDPRAPYCAVIEDGVWSANYFIYSGAPTSNMVGGNTDSDAEVDVLTDREGCRAIYPDQVAAGAPLCAGAAADQDEKSEVFYQRSSERNRYELESIQLDIVFNMGGEVSVLENGNLVESAGSYFAYPSREWNLAFRPRYQIESFLATYDGETHEQIPDTVESDLALAFSGVLEDASAGYIRAQTVRRPGYTVTLQTDLESSTLPAQATDTLFLLDSGTSPDPDPDCTSRQWTVNPGYTSASFAMEYPMNYGVRDASCGGAVGTSTNTYENPTVEQWVCDRVSMARYSAPSCYYTAYLELQDRHADPLPLTVLGAVAQSLNGNGLLDNGETLSVVASPDAIALRNVMYAQVLRYVAGRTAQGGSLDEEMQPSSGILSLMDGDLLFAHGDVEVNGGANFTDKTLVVLGGNVTLNEDITDGRLGVIVFKENGVGGNVYIDPSVIELHANFFLDGALYSGNGVDTFEDEPSWANDEARLETLENQLYLHGSLLSRNTIGGAENPAAGVWELGDGTTTTDYALAREHDLNKLRQYRLCYPLDEDNNVDQTATPLPCEEGESLSDFGYESFNYATFIFDYAPSDGLPIFWEEAHLFQ